MRISELLNLSIKIVEKGDFHNEVIRLEQFFTTIDDGLVSDIFALRYRNGLDWNQIARHVSEVLTADDVEKLHDEFLLTMEA